MTYYDDVAPIFADRCVSCHHENTVAPMPLRTYEHAFAYRKAIEAAVGERTMPPWSPDNACRNYRENRSLTEEQIATVLAWVRQGAPAGTPPVSPAPLTFTTTSLSRVDHTVVGPVYSIAPPAGELDDHRCFLVDWPYENTRYITGAEILPGNLALAHHVGVIVAGPDKVAAAEALDAADPGPGWRCDGGGGEVASGMISAWAPGMRGRDFPPGHGVAIEPGSKIVLDMHYNTLFAAGGTDQTRVNFKLEKAARRLFPMLILSLNWLTGAFRIQPGEERTFEFEYDPTILTMGRRFKIHNAYLHMHQLGRSGRLLLQRSDGTEECLLDLPRFDFSWQSEYWFEEPVTVFPDDRLYIQCTIDNTAGNQRVVNGVRETPRLVEWGGDYPDEMCAGFFIASW